MSLVTLQIQSYQVPKFYRLLDSLGVIQIPPKHTFEVYRGHLKGIGDIVIYHNGQITYQNVPTINNLVSRAVNQLQSTEITIRKRAVMLARPSPPKKPVQFATSHLNIWLTRAQYTSALDAFYNTSRFNFQQSNEGYIDAVFNYKNHKIAFHTNGKVITKTGYQVFEPVLREVIKENIPYPEYDLIIGQDEVGSGERIGPLVVSTVALTPNQMIELQIAGIKDSKMMPLSIMEAMGQKVAEESKLSMSWIMPPSDFDSEYEATQGVVDLLWQGHSALTHKLIEELEYHGKKVLVLIDQFSPNFSKYTSHYNDLNVEVELIPNGEQQSVSVAAASIFAKAKRQRWIRINEKVYGMKFKRSNIDRISRQNFAQTILKW